MANQQDVVEKDDPVLEEATDQDTAEELKAKLAKANSNLTEAIRTKQNWRGKAVDPKTGKDYKTLFEEAQASTNKPTPTQPEPIAPAADERIKRLEMAEDKRQFGHAHGLSPEETDHVFAFAQGTGIKPKDALESAFIKNGLEAMRRQAKVDAATLGPSSRSPIVEGKTVKEMTSEERKKNFGKIVEATTRK